MNGVTGVILSPEQFAELQSYKDKITATDEGIRARVEKELSNCFMDVVLDLTNRGFLRFGLPDEVMASARTPFDAKQAIMAEMKRSLERNRRKTT